MSLIIEGTITQSLEAETGTGANGDWEKRVFILVEDKEQYPKTIAFEVWKKDIEISVGDKIKASINLESREYNGRWYTGIKAWKVELIGNNKPVENNKPVVNEPLETDNLPF